MPKPPSILFCYFQEMQLKIELGFINAISYLFEEEEILGENTNEKLDKDLEMARKPLQVLGLDLYWLYQQVLFVIFLIFLVLSF